MKKIVWTALFAVTTAAAAALAVKALRYAWTRFAEEEPPEAPWWARMLVGAPLGKAMKLGIEPTA